MGKKLLILKGDCICPELVNEAIKVLRKISQLYSIDFEMTEGLLGGAAYDETGDPCPECFALTMVRNGTCQRCDSCGATTGCS